MSDERGSDLALNQACSELAKHVRAIHFTLLLICLAVGVAVFLSESQEVDRALGQARTIQAMVNGWNEGFLPRGINHTLNNLPPEQRLLAEETRKGPSLLDVSGRNVLATIQPLSIVDLKTLYCLEAREVDPQLLTLDPRRNTRVVKPPMSLQDFRAAWNTLDCVRRMYVFANIRNTATRALLADEEDPVLLGPTQWITDAERVLRARRELTGKRRAEVYLSLVHGALSPLPDAQRRRIPPTHKEFDNPVHESTFFGLSQEFIARESDDPAATRNTNIFRRPLTEEERARVFGPSEFAASLKWIFISVETARFAISGQEFLMTDSGVDPSTVIQGDFATSFPDLAARSQHLGSIGFADLVGMLDEARHREGSVVELLGARIPFEQVARIGLLLLACVQAYLILHLLELSKFVISSPAVLPAVWIGMFRSRAAQLVTLFTTTLLPGALYAVLLLRLHAAAEMQLWSTLLTAMLAIALVLGTLLALRHLWRQLGFISGGNPSRPATPSSPAVVDTDAQGDRRG